MTAQKPSDVRGFPPAVSLFAAILAAMLLFAPSTAWAHKVNVFAYVEGDTVITESYFSDGRACRDSTIEVFDARGNKLVEGKTDIEGQFSFRAPAKTDLLIRLSAAMGHQAEYTLPAADLPDTLPEGLPAAPEPAAEPAEAPPAQPEFGAHEEIATKDVELLEKAVARQLAPIRRMLEESQRKQRVSDIVGGIGYIIGLMGLVLYFHGKRRRQ